ncbi:hypothetical protein HDU91_003422, partial [Kappamyces sp. JEL0680]
VGVPPQNPMGMNARQMNQQMFNQRQMQQMQNYSGGRPMGGMMNHQLQMNAGAANARPQAMATPNMFSADFQGSPQQMNAQLPANGSPQGESLGMSQPKSPPASVKTPVTKQETPKVPANIPASSLQANAPSSIPQSGNSQSQNSGGPALTNSQGGMSQMNFSQNHGVGALPNQQKQRQLSEGLPMSQMMPGMSGPGNPQQMMTFLNQQQQLGMPPQMSQQQMRQLYSQQAPAAGGSQNMAFANTGASAMQQPPQMMKQMAGMPYSNPALANQRPSQVQIGGPFSSQSSNPSVNVAEQGTPTHANL